MIKDLNAYAVAHGYQIIKTRKCIKLPIIKRYIWLPIWLTWELEYQSKKRSRYTLEGFIIKLQNKRERRCKKKLKITFQPA